jgi:hypothetical protein
LTSTPAPVEVQPVTAPVPPEQRVAQLQLQSEVRQHVEQNAGGEQQPERRTVFKRGSGWLPEQSDVYLAQDESKTRSVFKRDGQQRPDYNPVVDVYDTSPKPTVFRRGSGYLMQNNPIQSPSEIAPQRGPFNN